MASVLTATSRPAASTQDAAERAAVACSV